MTADIRSCRRVAQPSPKHGIFACVVAVFPYLMDMSGARFINWNLVFFLTIYGHPNDSAEIHPALPGCLVKLWICWPSFATGPIVPDLLPPV